MRVCQAREGNGNKRGTPLAGSGTVKSRGNDCTSKVSTVYRVQLVVSG